MEFDPTRDWSDFVRIYPYGLADATLEERFLAVSPGVNVTQVPVDISIGSNAPSAGNDSKMNK